MCVYMYIYVYIYIYIQKVRKLVLVRKFRKKSVIFIFGRLIDSVNSLEFN